MPAPDYLAEIHIEEALISIGFKENISGGLECQWQGLSIAACRWKGGGWLLSIQQLTSRTLTDYEKVLPEVAIKGWYYAEIYQIWREAFPINQALLFPETIPAKLIPGQEYIEYQQVLHKLVPPNPWIKVDRLFMRELVNKLKKLAGDDPEVDFYITLHLHLDQFILFSNTNFFLYPATANWFGRVTVSMRDFLGVCKRFNNDPVRLEYSDSCLKIDNKNIEAEWHEDLPS
jgi:hypothetical protein